MTSTRSEEKFNKFLAIFGGTIIGGLVLIIAITIVQEIIQHS